MFSKRTDWSRAPSRLSELVALASGPLLDLTESNPTLAGFTAPSVVAELGDARGATYRPEPRGMLSAREAICGYYRERGASVSPEQVVLTASTSEAYGWMFKLFCEPGDCVLVPAPPYPLLPLLADLEEVRLVRYPHVREECWRIDLGATERLLAENRARAVTLVHPGNPTGSFTRRDEACALATMARRYDAALLVDEVFSDYAHGVLAPDRQPTFAGGTEALTIVMSGLSKVALSPQLKLGWVVVAGADEATRREALERLEVIADCYLSVATPVQLALPKILAAAPALQAQVRERLRKNLAVLDATLLLAGLDSPVRRLAMDGGWYALVQLPRTRDDDQWLERTLAAGVLVHPGYFFEVATAGMMVVSLLTDEATFAEGIARAVAVWSEA